MAQIQAEIILLCLHGTLHIAILVIFSLRKKNLKVNWDPLTKIYKGTQKNNFDCTHLNLGGKVGHT